MMSMVLGFLNIGTSEMLLIVFVALLLFGGKKLPELARGLGRGIREFKDASETIKRDISEQINNFEKDVDIKSVMVEDVESAVGNAQKSLEQHNDSSQKPSEDPKKSEEDLQKSNPDSAKTETAKSNPGFTPGPPVGTYQHQPGREPDYVGSQDVYYNNPELSTPDDDSDNDPQIKPQQSTDHS